MKRIAAMIGIGSTLVACAAALGATALSGTYDTTVAHGSVAGAWSIDFKAPKYTIDHNGSSVVNGTFTVSGSKVTFNDKSGKAACPGPGVYSYSVSGLTLKFKLVSDKSSHCAGRRAVLASTFTKKFSSTPGNGY